MLPPKHLKKKKKIYWYTSDIGVTQVTFQCIFTPAKFMVSIISSDNKFHSMIIHCMENNFLIDFVFPSHISISMTSCKQGKFLFYLMCGNHSFARITMFASDLISENSYNFNLNIQSCVPYSLHWMFQKTSPAPLILNLVDGPIEGEPLFAITVL